MIIYLSMFRTYIKLQFFLKKDYIEFSNKNEETFSFREILVL